MPKVVDHEARRREIAEALWRIAGREGLEAVSLARVAQEAGISKGRVQHYFASREEMLAFTARYLRDRIETRLHTAVEAADPQAPLEVVGAILTALLPADDDTRSDALVASAFLVRAVADPQAAAVTRRGQAGLLDLLAGRIAAAREAGEVRAEIDPRREAEVLLALAGGLGEAMLLGRHTAQTALDVLAYQLTRLRRREMSPTVPKVPS